MIAVNRRARHDYFIEDRFEAGLALEGWEVKSLRAGNAQLTEAYVNLKKGEAWLVGAHFSPLKTASTHITTDPTRARKLLMHRREIDRLLGRVIERGLTLVPLRVYFRRGRAKVEIAVARGKRAHDKRDQLRKDAAHREIEQEMRRRR